jgi:hypothetical protein
MKQIMDSPAADADHKSQEQAIGHGGSHRIPGYGGKIKNDLASDQANYGCQHTPE